MKLSYQLATTDVKLSPLVTSYQGDTEKGFALLNDHGYDGVELMVRDPDSLDAQYILSLARTYKLEIPMLATGEIFGQDKLSLTDEREDIRIAAKIRMKKVIDFAALLKAQVNIGRLRGQYQPHIPVETTYKLAIDAFREIAAYAQSRNVIIALEPVNILQCNFIKSTQDGMKIVDAVGNANFKIMLDLFHMNIEDRDIYKSIEESTGYFSYVHFTDSNRMFPGNCKFDFPSIVQELRKTGYDGYLGIEVFQLPDQETAIKKSAEYIKPLIK